jgi:hypothetical protein
MARWKTMFQHPWHPLFGIDGQVTITATANLDHQVRAEARMKDHDARYHSLFESIDEGFSH